MRTLLLVMLGLLLVSNSSHAQGPWSDKLFKQGDKPPVLDHNFGNVPHGTQLYYRMPIQNKWGIPLQVDARVGCHCVSVSPETQVLQPNQKSHLDIRMDAGRYTGPRTVNVFVTLSGANAYSMSTLRVSAFSRTDVVLNPSQVNLGVVEAGQSTPQQVNVEYAGGLDWRIEGAEDTGPLDVKYRELYRRPGQVAYQVSVAVKPSASAGNLMRTVYLKTNDPAGPRVPLLVEGMVRAGLSAVPRVLAFGNVEVGQSVTKMVLVRGPRPFRITHIDGLQNGLQAPLPSADKAVQVVKIAWKPTKPGPLHQNLTIVTDLGQPTSVQVTLEGTATPSARASLDSQAKQRAAR